MIGVLAPGAGTLRRRRSFRLGAVIGAILPVAVLLAFSLVSDRGSSSTEAVPPEVADQRRALAAFEEALEPVAAAGATTVVYGMRPGINDVYENRFDDETLVTMAQGWVEAMTAVRNDFAELEVPAFLTETTELYARSFDAYHETAKALLTAARASGDERVSAVQTAAGHGTKADQLYDRADAELQEHRARLGLITE